MKQRLLLLLLLLASWSAQAQLLQQQSFEGTGTDAVAANGYTATTVASGNSNIYFYNASLPVPGFNTGSGQVSTVTNINGIAAGSSGTRFWASENVRRDAAGNVRGNPPATVTLNAVNVSGKSNLSVTVALADASGPATGSTAANPEGTGGNTVFRWETDDYVRVQYNLDNAGWVTIGQFVGDDPGTGGAAGRLRQDANRDGISNYDIEPNSPILTQTLTDYTFAIPGSGTSLQVRVQIDQDGASEEFGFDNIRVYGAAAASAAPVLGNLEGSALAYNEGAAATAVTSSLTVADADNTTLSSATVTISTNFQASEDLLSFTGDGTTNNIAAGAFDTSLGRLTLTSAGSTATLAEWQSALRKVLYRNTDANDASPLTRTVSFSITDPTGVTSSIVSRNITVTTALDPAYVGLPYVETFENPDGEGTRYASNHYFTADAAQFQRVNANPIPGGTSFTNVAGQYYWAGVNTGFSNPTGTLNGTVTTRQINAAGYANLRFQLRIGASLTVANGNSANWTTTDYFQLLYRESGSSTWMAFGLFRGTSTSTNGGVMRQDSNPNGTGVPTGTQLTAALQNFTFDLPTSLNGKTVDFQLVLVNSGGTDYLAFDQLQVTGTPQTTVNSIVRASANPTNAATVNYTVTFGSAVTGLTAANFSLTTTGSVSGATVGTPVAGSGTTWTVPVNTGTGSGTLTLNLTNDTNLSADITTTLPFAGETYTIDKTAPTVTISSTAGASGSTTTTTPIPFAVTFSESVTGFVQGDLTVTGGSIVAGSFSGSGSGPYTFNVTPSGSGSTVTVNVAAGVAQDAAGNGNTASNSVSVQFQILVTATPTITSPASGIQTNATTIAVAGTAVAGSLVRVYNASTNAVLGSQQLAAGATAFSISIPLAANATTTFYATAQLSGQTESPATSSVSVIQDSTSPTVTAFSSTTGASGSLTTASSFPFSVTFSEAVTGFSASGITVTNGTVVSGSVSGSGSGPYTFTVTPTTAGTVTTVTIAAGAAQDGASNPSVASSTYSLTYVTLLTWTGAVNTSWFNSGNWSPATVPGSTVDALIPAGAPRYPIISAAGTASVRSLTIAAGGSLTQTIGTLDVRGDLTVNGTFVTTDAAGTSGGTVSMGQTARSGGPNILGSQAIRFWNLTVLANGLQLSTSAGASVRRTLSLTGNLATNGNSFTLESASTGDALVVNNGGVVTGSATVQRYIDPSQNTGLGYRHYSAPVSNSTVADLATTPSGGSFSPVVNSNYNTSATPNFERPFPTVFGYDERRTLLSNNLSSFDKGYFSPAALSDALTPGRGYTVNIGANQLVDFVGTLNNGDLPLSLSSNRASNSDAGWHLVGNPYPAPLSYNLVAAADRLNMDGAIYVFSSSSQYGGQYRSYNNGFGNPVVPMGQGFFVRVSSGASAGALTFRNSQRLTAPDGTTFQRPAEMRPVVQLTLHGTGSPLTDEAYVYFQAGATAGFDAEFDATKLTNPSGLNLSAQGVGQLLAIDGQPVLGTTQRVVPLAVGVPTAGSYTLTAAQLLNLSQVPTYLRDKQTGALIDLAQQPSYSFTVSTAAALLTQRFELVFSPQQVLAATPAALAEQVGLYPNPAKSQATVELPTGLGRQAVMATLVDAMGRTVRQQVLPAGLTSHTLLLNELATGMYSLRLSTNAGLLVKKLVIE